LFMPDRARFAPTPVVCTPVTAWRCHKSCAWGGMNNSPSSWFFNHSSASSIFEHSLVTVALCRPVVEAVQRKDRDSASWFFNHSSASQIRRAVSSVSLNLAEVAFLLFVLFDICSCGGRTDDGRDRGTSARGGQLGVGGGSIANSLSGSSSTGGRSSTNTNSTGAADADVPVCSYTLTTSSLPDVNALPECTINGLCDAALSRARVSDGCQAGPVAGYFVVNCSSINGLVPSTSDFCERDWPSLKAACVAGSGNAELLENCNGFDIARTATMHFVNFYYYDRVSGKLVGQLAMSGFGGDGAYSIAGVQLASGGLDTVGDCSPITCGTSASN